MTGARRFRRLRPVTALGLVGSLLVAVGAPGAVHDSAVPWWYHPGWPSGRAAGLALLYAGMIVLCVAWLLLGGLVATRRLETVERAPTVRDLIIIAVIWTLPLALGPPLFSRDVYSYLAQGTIVHLGLNPYHDTPAVLAAHGHAHVLGAVSPFWRHTPAPYGPLFLALVSAVVSATGSHLVAGVLAIRGLELAGAILLAIAVPRLARALGTDPVRAIWLALLSPLLMLELVAAGHNDILMIGLLAAGAAAALEGRPLAGIALCALAATIKVPALAGVVFIAVAWARAENSASARARFALAAAAIAAAVLGAVSILTGLGISWLSGAVFSTPARVRLAITPATGLGWTVASVLHDAGLGVNTRAVESAFAAVAAVLTVAAGLVLLRRTRVSSLIPSLGVFLLVAAAGGPAAWPWYFSWGIVLVAACRGAQRSAMLALALAVAVFVVKPGGILALPIETSPAVVVVYALIAGAAWLARRSRGGGRGGSGAAGSDGPSLADGAPTALART